MEIRRDRYLEALKVRMHNGMIKVVTGIRRCGKSYLLFHIFRNYLIEGGVGEDHIISIELDQRKNRELRDPDKILDYIDRNIHDADQYYILLDEVQMLDDFEEVLNSLLHIGNVDVYVTGSNSKFLSRDVITEFRGRGDEIHLYPLSFREFMEAYEGDRYAGWADYIMFGGLPLTVTMKTQEQKIQYLSNLFTETYLKDIVERNNITRIQELNDLINVIASSVGSLTNPNNIGNTFKSVMGSNISVNTIRQYIEYLKDAFMVSEVQRYDIKGRKYIGSPVKYYFEDVGLRNARLGFRQVEETHLMENIIYNELRMRGFQVDVGMVQKREPTPEGTTAKKQLEVDFVASLGSRKYYIQSAYSLPDENKVRQEKASLTNIRDSFKKIIIVKDVINIGHDEDGVEYIDIYDFLLRENSLEL